MFIITFLKGMLYDIAMLLISVENAILIGLVVGSLIVGGLIFLLACIFHVKKGTCIIIEKVEEFYGIYYPGYYFFWPFAYRRRGTYPTGVAKKTIRLNNGRSACVAYKIIDVKKYHYTNISIETCFNNVAINNEVVTLDILKNELLAIGVELVNLTQVE